MTELATRHACTQAKVTDTDRIVLVGIGKSVVSLGHCTNKDTDALLWLKVLNIVADPYNGGIETQGDFSAVWR